MTSAPQNPATAEEILSWLALRLIPGLGSRRALQLLERFGSVQALFRAPASELMGDVVSATVARAISGGHTFDEAVDQQTRALGAGAAIIPFHDSRYPAMLREIYDPPLLLFARGRTELLATPMVAIVGSRRATPYGHAVAEKFGSDLAARGVTVVSGMARGIDTSAHQGALETGGKTLAVFGCGVDLIYPAENRKLADRIARDGLLLSEFPMATPAYPQNFPVRNRIVSGISYGILVVEGAQYSGSSITARLALDQDREVWAVPGNITSKMSWGPNLLIKQGAHLVQVVDDIIEALPLETRRHLAASDANRGDPSGSQTELPFGPMSAVCQQVLENLQVDKAVGLDELVERVLDSSPSEIIAALFELELAGRVRQLPGKQFVRIWT